MIETPKQPITDNSNNSALRYHSRNSIETFNSATQKSSDKALLGNYHGIRVQVTPTHKKPSLSSAKKTEKKYDLLHESQRVLDGINKRIYACCKIVVPGKTNVAVYRSDSGGAHYRNLCRCECWQDCPVCSESMGLISKAKLTIAIDNWRAGGGSVLMLTETLSHKLDTPLKELILALIKINRAMTAHRTFKSLRRRFGIVHSVKSFEDTYGDDNGWHPHFHILFFMRKKLSRLQLAELEASIKTLYLSIVKAKGFSASWEHGAKLTQDRKDIAKYVSKQGLVDDSEGAKDLAWEVGMSKTKKGRKEGRINSWGILEAIKNAREAKEAFGTPTSEDEEKHLNELVAEQMKYERLWIERSKALKRKHHLQWSPGAKNALGVTEQAITDKINEEEVSTNVQAFASIPLLLWRAIRAKKMQGAILALAIESPSLDDFWNGLWAFDEGRCLHEELRDLRRWDFTPTEERDAYEGAVW